MKVAEIVITLECAISGTLEKTRIAQRKRDKLYNEESGEEREKKKWFAPVNGRTMAK